MNVCCNALLHCTAHFFFFFFTFILILCAAAHGDALQDVDMRCTAQKLLILCAAVYYTMSKCAVLHENKTSFFFIYVHINTVWVLDLCKETTASTQRAFHTFCCCCKRNAQDIRRITRFLHWVVQPSGAGVNKT